MHYIEEIKQYQPINEQEVMDKQLIIDYVECHDQVLTREHVVAHVTASSWILNQTHDRVLLVFHNIYNSWSWTGGHADKEADLLQVALKEAKEETGLKRIFPIDPHIFSIESLCVNGHVKRGKYVSSHLHLNVTYLLEANDQDLLFEKVDENKAVRWFTFEEVLGAPNEEWMVKVIYQKLYGKVQRLITQGIL
ncbi:MAG: NUDIX hydrolase [Bacilli bacterium]